MANGRELVESFPGENEITMEDARPQQRTATQAQRNASKVRLNEREDVRAVSAYIRRCVALRCTPAAASCRWPWLIVSSIDARL